MLLRYYEVIRGKQRNGDPKTGSIWRKFGNLSNFLFQAKIVIYTLFAPNPFNCYCVVLENIHNLCMESCLVYTSHHPLWKFQFSSILSFNSFAICPLPPPSPLEFLLTCCGGGVDIFCNCTFQTSL